MNNYLKLFLLIIFCIIVIKIKTKEAFIDFKSRKVAVKNINNNKFKSNLSKNNYSRYKRGTSARDIKENEHLNYLLPKNKSR